MMRYVSQLSRVQIVWLAGSLAAAVVVCGIGAVLEPRGRVGAPPPLTTATTIRQIAPRLDATGKALAREPGLPLEISKDKAVAELGVSQEALDAVAAHLSSHHGTTLKYFMFAAIVFWGLVFLVRLGRPDGATNAEGGMWYPRAPHIASLTVAVAVCGFALGKSPNPMEGAVKVFKAMVGLQVSVWATIGAFVFFIALATVGNKLVCGWACPFGALQELVYSLPVLRRTKRWRVPFWCSNLVRAGLFIVMLLMLFGIVGGQRGFVLYHSLTPLWAIVSVACAPALPRVVFLFSRVSKVSRSASTRRKQRQRPNAGSMAASRDGSTAVTTILPGRCLGTADSGCGGASDLCQPRPQPRPHPLPRPACPTVTPRGPALPQAQTGRRPASRSSTAVLPKVTAWAM